MPGFRIQVVNWAAFKDRLLAIRTEVFVEEQGIDPAIEVDGRDPGYTHFLAVLGDEDVGTARMNQRGHIGRVAVRKQLRGQGIGSALLEACCLEAGRCGLRKVDLNAQSHALRFYAERGFEVDGEEFEEAGIPHRRMRRKI